MKRALAHASPSHVTTQIEAFGQMKGSLNRAVVALRTRSISGMTSPWLHTTAASFSLRSSSASARASAPSAPSARRTSSSTATPRRAASGSSDCVQRRYGLLTRRPAPDAASVSAMAAACLWPLVVRGQVSSVPSQLERLPAWAWRATYSLMGAAPAAGSGEGGAAPHDDARPGPDGSPRGGERAQVGEDAG